MRAQLNSAKIPHYLQEGVKIIPQVNTLKNTNNNQKN